MNQTITLIINGEKRTVTTDRDRPLLEALREDLHMTGTKCGCGETPIIAVAPAIANAVFQASGVRIRSMPIRGTALKRS